uniref:Uncharacterized protein n=1 Tax=Rhizophora mucronata TaxID=61149 RepID=A0A2P2K684_RHIMU
MTFSVLLGSMSYSLAVTKEGTKSGGHFCGWLACIPKKYPNLNLPTTHNAEKT